MGKSLLTTAYPPHTTIAGSTQYMRLGVAQLSAVVVSNELNHQVPFYSTGTLSKLYARIIANTTTAPSTIRTRKNAANGNQSVSIPAGFTGPIEDTVNVDTVAPNDKLNYQIVTGAGGTLTIVILSVIFDADTNTISKLVSDFANIAIASTTRYFVSVGDISGQTAVEASTNQQLDIAGVLKNMSFYTRTNLRTNETIVKQRKNSVDSGLTVTIPGGVPLFAQDTTNTSSFAAGDRLNLAWTTGTGAEVMEMTNCAVDYETQDGHAVLTGSNIGVSADITVPFGTTTYIPICGGCKIDANEGNVRQKCRAPFTFKRLGLWIRTNTLNGNTVLRFRKNGSAGNQSVTIDAATAGFVADTINVDSCIDTDEVNHSVDTTAATSGSIVLQQVVVWTQEQAAEEGGGGGSTSGGGWGGGSQGRAPLYRQVRQPDIKVAVVRVQIPLQYEVERLSIQVRLPLLVPQKPIIKYASAILTPLARILALPIRPAPEPRQKEIVRVSIPLSYEVTGLQVKAGCSYEVERLITQKEQHKIIATSINFLLSDFI